MILQVILGERALVTVTADSPDDSGADDEVNSLKKSGGRQAYRRLMAGAGVVIAGAGVVMAPHQHSAVAFYAGTERRWPVGEGIDGLLSRENGGWVVDDPGMNRITKEEKALLTECREHKRGDSQFQTWRTEDGRDVRVYRIVP